MHNCTMSCYN